MCWDCLWWICCKPSEGGTEVSVPGDTGGFGNLGGGVHGGHGGHSGGGWGGHVGGGFDRGGHGGGHRILRMKKCKFSLTCKLYTLCTRLWISLSAENCSAKNYLPNENSIRAKSLQNWYLYMFFFYKITLRVNLWGMGYKPTLRGQPNLKQGFWRVGGISQNRGWFSK